MANSAPKNAPDASVTRDYPVKPTSINLSGDTDLTAVYAQGYAKRIYVGGAGSVKVDTIGATGVTYTAVPVGTWLRGTFTKVYSTANGTTATNLVAED